MPLIRENPRTVPPARSLRFDDAPQIVAVRVAVITFSQPSLLLREEEEEMREEEGAMASGSKSRQRMMWPPDQPADDPSTPRSLSTLLPPPSGADLGHRPAILPAIAADDEEEQRIRDAAQLPKPRTLPGPGSPERSPEREGTSPPRSPPHSPSASLGKRQKEQARRRRCCGIARCIPWATQSGAAMWSRFFDLLATALAQLPLVVALLTPLLLTSLVASARYSAVAVLVTLLMSTLAIFAFLVAPVGPSEADKKQAPAAGSEDDDAPKSLLAQAAQTRKEIATKVKQAKAKPRQTLTNFCYDTGLSCGAHLLTCLEPILAWISLRFAECIQLSMGISAVSSAYALSMHAHSMVLASAAIVTICMVVQVSVPAA